MPLATRRQKSSSPPQEEASVKPAAQAIKELEECTGRRIIVYTSQRFLGPWDVPPLYSLLAKMGHQEKLSVVVQSHGGFQDDAFKMANVIREFAGDVTFIVPTYANSAATLLCLSGNRIAMGPTSELGPTNPMMDVDERLITPTVVEPADLRGEPKDRDPKRRQMAAHALRDFLIAAGVLKEDGSGYDPEVLSVYIQRGILNPFLLGDFERSGKTAMQYAENLLRMYMFREFDDANGRAADTARKLCEGYYDHSYPISRREARDVLRLEVEDMSEELWRRTSELMLAYDKMMESQRIATILETSDAFEITHWAPSPSSAPV